MKPVLSLETQSAEAEIIDNCRPHDGLVLVSGPAASGRSTLVAGMTAAKLVDRQRIFRIVESAAPIEFLFNHVAGSSSTIRQHEAPRHLPSSAEVVRRAMAWSPTDVIIDELQDVKTMCAAIRSAVSGISVTATIHASTVASTIQRIASLVPDDEREALIPALARSVRLIVNQRLTRSIGGEPTALREVLVFDPELRGKFLETDPTEWPALTQQAVRERGQSYELSIRNALEAGRISEETAADEMREEG